MTLFGLPMPKARSITGNIDFNQMLNHWQYRHAKAAAVTDAKGGCGSNRLPLDVAIICTRIKHGTWHDNGVAALGVPADAAVADVCAQAAARDGGASPGR
jgi:hypothetical protein